MYNTSAFLKLATLTPFNTTVFSEFLQLLTSDLPDSQQIVHTMVQELQVTVFSNITVSQLLESAILIAAQNIQTNINFDKVAARLQVQAIYFDAFRYNSGNNSDFEITYKQAFSQYINLAVQQDLLSANAISKYDLNQLASLLIPQNDDLLMFVGITTAQKRYMLHDREQKILETPQFMWMRIAMGLAYKEQDPAKWVKEFYIKLSNLDYIPGGSTNIGSATNYPILSNCYLIDTQDDIHSIYDNIKNVALISKATGGIGISITKLRASGAPVKSNNTISTGPIPFVKVMDTALKSMSRGGKKFGAMCIYMENWHLDINDFIDLKQNAGDDYRRIRTADTAVYLSDEFMKRVINNQDWYMFDPYDTPDLAELYGSDFSQKYMEYIQKAQTGEIPRFKVIPAREQFKQILTSMTGTSHPWITWKDTINLRALNNNTGTIHSSNLCTEITLPTDANNIAVCNLAYVNLAAHVSKQAGGAVVDWTKLESTVRVLMRHLDNLVEVNELNLKEAINSDTNNRAVGMGMSGFTEVLEKFGFAYDSQDSYNLIDKLTEFISYTSIDESCNLATERGAYPNFDGSMWSKGLVPLDTVAKVAANRLGQEFTNQPSSNSILRKLQDIKSTLDSATDNHSQNLSQIAAQLLNYAKSVDLNTNTASSNEALPNEPTGGIELKQSKASSLDWEVLRNRVKQGIRNATTMAIAPNASTGLVLGTSPGLDPRFAQIFSRNTANGKFLDINHNLVKDLQDLGLWEQVQDLVIQNYGDISEIPQIPDHLKQVYKTSFQISPYAYVEVASRAQKWIDQAISRNMYLETREPEEMMEIYTEAWRRGLKTTYYLHTKPRHSAEQSNTKVNKSEQIMANKSGATSRGFGFSGLSTNTSAEAVAPAVPATLQTQTASDLETKTVPLQQVMEVKQSGGSSSLGFSAAVNVLAAPEKAYYFASSSGNALANSAAHLACPTDPAERANCEACQ